MKIRNIAITYDDQVEVAEDLIMHISRFSIRPSSIGHIIEEAGLNGDAEATQSRVDVHQLMHFFRIKRRKQCDD